MLIEWNSWGQKSREAAPKKEHSYVWLFFVGSRVKSAKFAPPSSPASGRRCSYLRSGWVCVATSRVPAESRACRLCTAAFCTDSPFSNVPLWRAPAREQEAPVREWVGAARRGVPGVEPRCDVNALDSRRWEEEVIPGGEEEGVQVSLDGEKRKRETSGLIKSPHSQRTIKHINICSVTMGLSMPTMVVGYWAS